MTTSYWGVDHGSTPEDIEKALGMARFAGAAKTIKRGFQAGKQTGGISGGLKTAKGALKPAGQLARGGLRQMGQGIKQGAQTGASAVGNTASAGAQGAGAGIKRVGGFAKQNPVKAAAVTTGGAGAIAAPFIAYNAGQKRQPVGKSMFNREPKKPKPMAERGALHRPTVYNSRATNAAKWSAGGAANGALVGAYAGGVEGKRGAAIGAGVGAGLGAVAGAGLGAAAPSKNHKDAPAARKSVQRMVDNEYKFKQGRHGAKKAGTWKQNKKAIRSDFAAAEHKRVANYFKETRGN